jgi:hypothetical protein
MEQALETLTASFEKKNAQIQRLSSRVLTSERWRQTSLSLPKSTPSSTGSHGLSPRPRLEKRITTLKVILKMNVEFIRNLSGLSTTWPSSSGKTKQIRVEEIEEIEETGGESESTPLENAGCHTINAPDAGEWGAPEA